MFEKTRKVGKSKRHHIEKSKKKTTGGGEEEECKEKKNSTLVAWGQDYHREKTRGKSYS